MLLWNLAKRKRKAWQKEWSQKKWGFVRTKPFYHNFCKYIHVPTTLWLITLNMVKQGHCSSRGGRPWSISLLWSIPYSNDLVKGTSVALESRRKPYRSWRRQLKWYDVICRNTNSKNGHGRLPKFDTHIHKAQEKRASETCKRIYSRDKRRYRLDDLETEALTSVFIAYERILKNRGGSILRHVCQSVASRK